MAVSIALEIGCVTLGIISIVLEKVSISF